MTSQIFKKFSEASARAKELAINGSKNVRVTKSNDGFIVHSDSNNSSNQVVDIDFLIEMIADAKAYTETKEDCEQYKLEISELIKNLTDVDSKVLAHAKRTIRELDELILKLPSSIEKDNQRLKKEKLSHLQSNAPVCKVHNIKMVLREAENGYFWGCPNFSLPAKDKCFQTKKLNKEELVILYE